MSVRNIRAHQARGLLDPPEVRARVGYYGPEHLAQLRLIRELQDDGFNLSGIKRLLDDTQGTADRLQRFGERSAPRAHRAGQTLTLEELGKRFRVSAQEAPEVLAEAERLGVLVPIGDGRLPGPEPVASGDRRGGRRAWDLAARRVYRCSRTSTATASRCRGRSSSCS